MQYIIAIGVFQAIIVVALLWKNKLKSSGDGLLMLLVGCIATHLGIKFLIYSLVTDAHVRQQMNTFIGFCYGPLLYLYAVKSRDEHFVPASKWYVFLPLVLGAIAYFTVAGVLFVSKSSDYRLLGWYNEISTFALLAAQLFFAFLALRISNKDLDQAKFREKKMIKHIAGCFFAITLFSIPFWTSTYLSVWVEPFLVRSVIYAILTLICILIGYEKIFDTEPMPEQISVDLLDVKASVEATPRKLQLSLERQQEIWAILENHLHEHKVFADSELNLDKLALATGLNKYHISETLNTYAQISFYQYINGHRIHYAIDQMEVLNRKDIPVNVLSLAYDAGFRAKSSFNRYFKEITGFTPTEHLKSLEQTRVSG